MTVRRDAALMDWQEFPIGLLQDSRLHSIFYKVLILIKFANDMKLKTENLPEIEIEAKTPWQTKAKMNFQDKM